jgi:hypothetical protein
MALNDPLNFLDITPTFAKPANGFTYSATELEGLWSIEVPLANITKGPLSKRWEYFLKSSRLPWRGQDRDEAIVQVLTNALVAEVINNPIADYPFINPERGTSGPMDGSDAPIKCMAVTGFKMYCNEDVMKDSDYCVNHQ